MASGNLPIRGGALLAEMSGDEPVKLAMNRSESVQPAHGLPILPTLDACLRPLEASPRHGMERAHTRSTGTPVAMPSSSIACNRLIKGVDHGN